MEKLIVIMAAAVIICAVSVKLIKKAKTIKNEVFGNAENMKFLLKEMKGAADNFAAEEKSLCSMTGLMLPQIKKDFPEFDWEEYRALVEKQVEAYIRKKFMQDSIKIHRTEIADYRRNNGSCTIRTQTSAGYTKEGKRIEMRFETLIAYVQDYLKLPQGQSGTGLTCPNCGAPVKILGSKYCEYCGAGIREINRRVWKIQETKEY